MDEKCAFYMVDSTAVSFYKHGKFRMQKMKFLKGGFSLIVER
jgi:hypothetical protein